MPALQSPYVLARARQARVPVFSNRAAVLVADFDVVDVMKKEYLGDGLYAHFDGFMITLSTQREAGEHYVALEPEVFEALIQYAIKIGWLKKDQVLR